eukprot:TRINITY_DN7695_c0_g1_i2.p1 TRINITY_DN7695_c0_g1~~TRINITY_DN7695_c0_g1_i2.p1  ORF type:complete len:347 (+),score=108.62 TRINITY_DN7695_c0_g1_i2:92-1042(+)
MPPALAVARAAAALARRTLAAQRAARGRCGAAAAEAEGRGAVQREEGTELASIQGALAQLEEGAARAAVLRREGTARASIELAALAALTRPQHRGRDRRPTVADALAIDAVAFCVASYADQDFGRLCGAAAEALVAVSCRRAVLLHGVDASLYSLQMRCGGSYLALFFFRTMIEGWVSGQPEAKEILLIHIVAFQRHFSLQESALAALRGPAARSLAELHQGVNELEARLQVPLTPFAPLPAHTPLLLPVAPGPRRRRRLRPPPLRWVVGGAVLAVLGRAVVVGEVTDIPSLKDELARCGAGLALGAVTACALKCL